MRALSITHNNIPWDLTTVLSHQLDGSSYLHLFIKVLLGKIRGGGEEIPLVIYLGMLIQLGVR